MTGRRIVLATRNTGKIEELRRILAEAAASVELVGVETFPDAPEVRETGETFEANALLKARALHQHTGLTAVADDSGLAVDALAGMPGIFSARWSGSHGDDAGNLALVLGQLADVPDERRGAAFVCAAAVVWDGGADVVTARLSGRLLHEPRGHNGFGYDPIFVPSGYDVTTAEMAATDKDAISHRGQAFRALAPRLAGLG